MQFYWLVLGILGVWRITHFFYAEDGPWDIVVRIRKFAGNGFFGKLMDCFYCLSVWIAAPIGYFMGASWKEKGLLWLALSGGAIVLEKLTDRQPPAPPAVYSEDKEEP